MTTYTFPTSTGPCTVDAAEPELGLLAYEVPADVHLPVPGRWVLAHYEGRVLAFFDSSEAATAAAEAVAPLVDWTRGAMTVANLLGPSGAQALNRALTAAGGQHPAV